MTSPFACAQANCKSFLVHSIWFDKRSPTKPVPSKYRGFVRSWHELHTADRTIHIVWNGAAALTFFRTYFPERLSFFRSLPTEVQQSDYFRLLLLFTYGGMYVDIDCQCHHPFVDSILSTAKTSGRCIFLVKSPLFTEEYTNCLMVSAIAGNSFWLDAADLVEETVCSVRNGHGLSKTAAFLFHLPLAGPLLQTPYTYALTGPTCLDRTIVRRPTYADDIVSLAASDFYRGGYVTHHEEGNWLASKMRFRIACVVCVMWSIVILWVLITR